MSPHCPGDMKQYSKEYDHRSWGSKPQDRREHILRFTCPEEFRIPLHRLHLILRDIYSSGDKERPLVLRHGRYSVEVASTSHDKPVPEKSLERVSSPKELDQSMVSSMSEPKKSSFGGPKISPKTSVKESTQIHNGISVEKKPLSIDKRSVYTQVLKHELDEPNISAGVRNFVPSGDFREDQEEVFMDAYNYMPANEPAIIDDEVDVNEFLHQPEDDQPPRQECHCHCLCSYESKSPCNDCEIYFLKCCKYECKVENLSTYSSTLENSCEVYNKALQCYCARLAATRIIIKHLQEKNNQLLQKWAAIVAGDA